MKTKQLKFVRKYLYQYKGVWLVDVNTPIYFAHKAIAICTELNNRILIKIQNKKMETPEDIMKSAFQKLSETRSLLEKAQLAYKKRNDEAIADPQNVKNIDKSILHLAHAYDEISAIWENDINV